jgi:putative endonuclease
MIVLYVLQGDAGKRYVGITNNLNRRLQEHRSGKTKGGQVIGEFELLYIEHFNDYKEARKREIFLKSGVGRKWLTDNYPRPGSAKGG